MAPERRERSRPKLIEKLEARREAYLDRGLVYRATWVTIGALVTVGGILMLALPGPAFVVIPIGLAMLSLQFAWAARLLERALEQAEVAKEKAANTSTRQRVISGLAAACALAAVIAAVLLWDIPFLPV